MPGYYEPTIATHAPKRDGSIVAFSDAVADQLLGADVPMLWPSAFATPSPDPVVLASVNQTISTGGSGALTINMTAFLQDPNTTHVLVGVRLFARIAAAFPDVNTAWINARIAPQGGGINLQICQANDVRSAATGNPGVWNHAMMLVSLNSSKEFDWELLWDTKGTNALNHATLLFYGEGKIPA